MLYRSLFFVLLMSFTITGCSLFAKKEVKPKQKTFDSSEEPPICTRIQYRYRSNKRPLGKADEAFQQQALKDSKRVYEAIKFIEGDSCSAGSIRDLFQKPKDCPGWKGPYIDQDLIEKYGAMSDEDFGPFLRCWKQPSPI